MKKVLLLLLFGIASFNGYTQYEYTASQGNPYGLVNPKAPKALKDYQPIIGICDCTSRTRNQDRSWAAPVQMRWEFKYIMNGMAVQDQTLKADGKHSGSIRQYDSKAEKWYVHYYSSQSASPKLKVWEGGMKVGEMVLYSEQKAPNGMEGFYKITFSNMSEKGFDWLGEWVNTDESIKYPTWKINCKKRE